MSLSIFYSLIDSVFSIRVFENLLFMGEMKGLNLLALVYLPAKINWTNEPSFVFLGISR